MKNLIKTLLFASIISVLSINLFGVSALAAETSSDSVLRRPIYCGASPTGNHHCNSKGTATLYRINSDGSKTRVFAGGAAWQCKWCQQVLVTQRDPNNYSEIGYYATWNPGYSISPNGTIVQTSSVYYSTGRSLSGYDLYY